MGFTSRTGNKRKRGRGTALNEESVGRGVAGQVGSCRGRCSSKFLKCDQCMTFALFLLFKEQQRLGFR